MDIEEVEYLEEYEDFVFTSGVGNQEENVQTFTNEEEYNSFYFVEETFDGESLIEEDVPFPLNYTNTNTDNSVNPNSLDLLDSNIIEEEETVNKTVDHERSNPRVRFSSTSKAEFIEDDFITTEEDITNPIKPKRKRFRNLSCDDEQSIIQSLKSVFEEDDDDDDSKSSGNLTNYEEIEEEQEEEEEGEKVEEPEEKELPKKEIQPLKSILKTRLDESHRVGNNSTGKATLITNEKGQNVIIRNTHPTTPFSIKSSITNSTSDIATKKIILGSIKTENPELKVYPEKGTTKILSQMEKVKSPVKRIIQTNQNIANKKPCMDGKIVTPIRRKFVDNLGSVGIKKISVDRTPFNRTEFIKSEMTNKRWNKMQEKFFKAEKEMIEKKNEKVASVMKKEIKLSEHSDISKTDDEFSRNKSLEKPVSNNSNLKSEKKSTTILSKNKDPVQRKNPDEDKNDKINEKKTIPKVNDRRSVEKINEKRPIEKIFEKKSTEDVNEKRSEKVNENRSAEKINEKPPNEKIVEKKSTEDVNEKRSEKVNEKKSVEKVNEKRSNEKIVERKSIEDVNEKRSVEKVNEKRSNEKIVEKKSMEDVNEKRCEKVNDKRSVEKVNEKKPIEKINENKTSEKVSGKRSIGKVKEKRSIEKVNEKESTGNVNEQKSKKDREKDYFSDNENERTIRTRKAVRFSPTTRNIENKKLKSAFSLSNLSERKSSTPKNQSGHSLKDPIDRDFFSDSESEILFTRKRRKRFLEEKILNQEVKKPEQPVNKEVSNSAKRKIVEREKTDVKSINDSKNDTKEIQSGVTKSEGINSSKINKEKANTRTKGRGRSKNASLIKLNIELKAKYKLRNLKVLLSRQVVNEIFKRSRELYPKETTNFTARIVETVNYGKSIIAKDSKQTILKTPKGGEILKSNKTTTSVSSKNVSFADDEEKNKTKSEIITSTGKKQPEELLVSNDNSAKNDDKSKSELKNTNEKNYRGKARIQNKEMNKSQDGNKMNLLTSSTITNEYKSTPTSIGQQQKPIEIKASIKSPGLQGERGIITINPKPIAKENNQFLSKQIYSIPETGMRLGNVNITRMESLDIKNTINIPEHLVVETKLITREEYLNKNLTQLTHLETPVVPNENPRISIGTPLTKKITKTVLPLTRNTSITPTISNQNNNKEIEKIFEKIQKLVDDEISRQVIRKLQQISEGFATGKVTPLKLKEKKINSKCDLKTATLIYDVLNDYFNGDGIIGIDGTISDVTSPDVEQILLTNSELSLPVKASTSTISASSSSIVPELLSSMTGSTPSNIPSGIIKQKLLVTPSNFPHSSNSPQVGDSSGSGGGGGGGTKRRTNLSKNVHRRNKSPDYFRFKKIRLPSKVNQTKVQDEVEKNKNISKDHTYSSSPENSTTIEDNLMTLSSPSLPVHNNEPLITPKNVHTIAQQPKPATIKRGQVKQQPKNNPEMESPQPAVVPQPFVKVYKQAIKKDCSGEIIIPDADVCMDEINRSTIIPSSLPSSSMITRKRAEEESQYKMVVNRTIKKVLIPNGEEAMNIEDVIISQDEELVAPAPAPAPSTKSSSLTLKEPILSTNKETADICLINKKLPSSSSSTTTTAATVGAIDHPTVATGDPLYSEEYSLDTGYQFKCHKCTVVLSSRPLIQDHVQRVHFKTSQSCYLCGIQLDQPHLLQHFLDVHSSASIASR